MPLFGTSKPSGSAALTLVGLTLLAAVGCTSTDHHLYESTVMRPTNVAVADATNSNVLWSYEIPVGYGLLLDFDTKGQIEPLKVNEVPATSLHWKLVPLKGKTDLYDEYPTARATKKGVVALPGVPVIQRVSFRPAPEYPEGYVQPTTTDAAPTPAKEAADAPADEPAATEKAPAPAPVAETAPADAAK